MLFNYTRVLSILGFLKEKKNNEDGNNKVM